MLYDSRQAYVSCLLKTKVPYPNIKWLMFHTSKTQALPIDRYQDAHMLAAKMQAVEVKSTQEHLGSLHA